MELNSAEIAKRIKMFLEERFGSVAQGIREMGKDPNSARNSFLRGHTLPNSEIIAWLLKFGADLNWIYFGIRGSPEIREPQLKYSNKKLEQEKKKLEEENENLRSKLGIIISTAQAKDLDDKLKGRDKKK